MIDNPENGQIPEMRDSEIRDKEANPAQRGQTATAVAEPDAEMSEPGETPLTESAPMAQTAGNQSAAIAEPLPGASEPVSEPEFASELTKFRQRFEEIQAEFIGEPRSAVQKAETLIDGLMDALRDQLQHIHTNVENETDTEQLRVAMLSYRELFGSLGGHRAP